MKGLNHLALVCSDMEKTVKFYYDNLGITVAKTINLPDGGQHFFLNVGSNQYLAYFWFNDDRESVPGVSVMDPKGGNSKMYMIAYPTGHLVSI
jgi:catechol 2,3-dioxygenase-like lactoylglutathione lyase family enzyme